jgi:hypothetical protein
MSRNLLIAAALVGETCCSFGLSRCSAADQYPSASSSSASSRSYTVARPPKASVTIRMSFRDRILAKYDLNGNGRLDGKEKTAASSDIGRYRAERRKVAYARQRYQQAVRTAQTAYVQAAMRPQATSFALPPSFSSSGRGHCKDSRSSTVNFSSPAMKRVNGPPPSSAPGLIRMPVSRSNCCRSGS